LELVLVLLEHGNLSEYTSTGRMLFQGVSLPNKNWTLPEKQLVAEIAVGLARSMFSILDGQDHIIYPEPGYVWHMATSDFEDGCSVLWHLDVAVAAYAQGQGRTNITARDDRTEKGWPPYFKFFTPEDIRERILHDLPATAPSLVEILSAYLGVMCNYGRSDTALSSEREPFIPPHQYVREIEALARVGYLERTGGTVVWTERIAPAMHQRLLWNDCSRPIMATETDRLASECAEVLAQTPELTRRLLTKEAKRLSELDFAALLRDRFEGLYWSRNPDGTQRSRKNAMLVQAVYLTLRESS
jgi:hypothetical protein